VETVHAVVLLPIFPSVSWLLWFLFASCHSEKIIIIYYYFLLLLLLLLLFGVIVVEAEAV
jgi:hypothetical protein